MVIQSCSIGVTFNTVTFSAKYCSNYGLAHNDQSLLKYSIDVQTENICFPLHLMALYVVQTVVPLTSQWACVLCCRTVKDVLISGAVCSATSFIIQVGSSSGPVALLGFNSLSCLSISLLPNTKLSMYVNGGVPLFGEEIFLW